MWMPAANKKRPKGSPCRTPLIDQITFCHTSRAAGWKAFRNQRSMDGHLRAKPTRMAGSAMELNAFFKSTCSKSHPVLPCRVST